MTGVRDPYRAADLRLGNALSRADRAQSAVRDALALLRDPNGTPAERSARFDAYIVAAEKSLTVQLEYSASVRAYMVAVREIVAGIDA